MNSCPIRGRLTTPTTSFCFSRDHLFQRHIQRLRQRGQDVRAAFALACLDLREVGFADSRRVRELLLGQSAKPVPPKTILTIERCPRPRPAADIECRGYFYEELRSRGTSPKDFEK